jgi:hypothetical protein
MIVILRVAGLNEDWFVMTGATVQGECSFALRSIAFPPWEISSPAPATVLQALRSGAALKSARRVSSNIAFFLDMGFSCR